jgi:hypothetical protein
MTNEEKIRKRFAAFAANFTCGVINPATLKERCTFARHEGPHSWSSAAQSEDIFGDRDISSVTVAEKLDDNRERFGTWARFNGMWYVRSSGTRRQRRMPGDIVRILAKDGSLKTVRLGDRVAPGVYDWFDCGEDEGEQEGANDQVQTEAHDQSTR